MHFSEEILSQFVRESKKYLETVEDELYDLEKQKHNPDILLIDKIFRIHHTIKEGAAFLGLNNITDLAFMMENMFSMIRAGEIKPEPVIVAALLEGAGCLNNLLDDVNRSNEVDISSVYKQLSNLLSGEVSEKVKKELETNITLTDMQGKKTGFEINQFSLKNLLAKEKNTYILKYDLMELSNHKNQTPLQLIRHLQSKGEIIQGRLMAILEDLHTGLPHHPLIYEVLFASVSDLRQLQESTGLPEENIIVVKRPVPREDFSKGYHPFEVFRDFILPDLCDRAGDQKARRNRGKSQVRLWSIGMPAGPELYLIALLVYEYVTARGIGISIEDFSILATDTSAEALSSAIIGKYSDSELNHGLVPGMKTEYFRREGTSWHIRDHIRSLIDFRQVNLTAPSTLPGNFDVIFCHNVFSAPESATEKTIVDRLHDVMSKNAYLFPGEDSRLTGMSGRFKKIKYGETIVYKKSQGPVEGK